jgi:uncharacterized protein (TIGR00369 family)
MKPLEALQKLVQGEAIELGTFRLPAPIQQTLGFQLTKVDAGLAVFRMQTSTSVHGNPMGTIHGGVLCDIADGAMGVACASTLDEGESFTTLELKINFIRPVWNAAIEARAHVVHRGKGLAYIECEVVTVPEEKLVAKVNSTCLVLRGAAADRR